MQLLLLDEYSYGINLVTAHLIIVPHYSSRLAENGVFGML